MGERGYKVAYPYTMNGLIEVTAILFNGRIYLTRAPESSVLVLAKVFPGMWLSVNQVIQMCPDSMPFG